MALAMLHGADRPQHGSDGSPTGLPHPAHLVDPSVGFPSGVVWVHALWVGNHGSYPGCAEITSARRSFLRTLLAHNGHDLLLSDVRNGHTPAEFANLREAFRPALTHWRRDLERAIGGSTAFMAADLRRPSARPFFRPKAELRVEPLDAALRPHLLDCLTRAAWGDGVSLDVNINPVPTDPLRFLAHAILPRWLTPTRVCVTVRAGAWSEEVRALAQRRLDAALLRWARRHRTFVRLFDQATFRITLEPPTAHEIARQQRSRATAPQQRSTAIGA